MRIIIGVLLLAATVGAQPPSPPASASQGVGMQPASTMSELMVKIIYPASDAIFYITTREPKSEAEWEELQGKALAVAESANLLMMPGRARDQDRWMQDAQLMLDAGRAAFRAAKAKDVAALDALNDQLYTSCTSCHQHYRPNYGRRPAATAPTVPAPPAPPAPPASPAPTATPTLEGRWKLRAAEDLRADGTVARHPWGEHPVGSIVVERGACYLQIMSTDTPAFAPGAATPTDQMKAALLSSYIAYSGPCTVNEGEGSVTLKVDAAWRPDYVGTEQKRFFRFENGVLLFGPAPGSIRAGNEALTRRLTLDRVP
jgi:Lipocalin-like domain